MTIDHWAFLVEPRIRRQVLVDMRRIANSTQRLHHLRVVHRADGACCVREPWNRTMERIRESLAGDGVGVAYLAVRSGRAS